MKRNDTTNELPLSKWWMTASAQAAIERGIQRKKAKFALRLAAVKAHKQKLADDVANWKEVI